MAIVRTIFLVLFSDHLVLVYKIQLTHLLGLRPMILLCHFYLRMLATVLYLRNLYKEQQICLLQRETSVRQFLFSCLPYRGVGGPDAVGEWQECWPPSGPILGKMCSTRP